MVQERVQISFLNVLVDNSKYLPGSRGLDQCSPTDRRWCCHSPRVTLSCTAWPLMSRCSPDLPWGRTPCHRSRCPWPCPCWWRRAWSGPSPPPGRRGSVGSAPCAGSRAQTSSVLQLISVIQISRHEKGAQLTLATLSWDAEYTGHRQQISSHRYDHWTNINKEKMPRK